MKQLSAILLVLFLTALLLGLTACAPEPDESAEAPDEPQAATETAAEPPEGFLEVTPPFSLDWDSDGEEETIDIRTVKVSNGSTAYHLELENGGSTWRSMNLGVWSVELFLTDLDGDGAPELFLSGDSGSVDYTTYCWHLTGSDPEPVKFSGETRYPNAASLELVDGRFCGLGGDGEVLLSSCLYMLGTYTGVRPYAFNDAGEIAPVEGSIWDYTENELAITTRIDLTADTASERNGVPDGGTLTLPAGTRLTLTGSDGVSRAWFATEDGRFGSFAAEKVDWQWFIAGMDENEVFSDLPYAG